MTPEEQKMLSDLANKVAQTPAPPIDREAEEFIRTRIGSRPDALYLMTQTVLIQNMALEQAKQQIQQLQQTSQTPALPSSSSFLGGQTQSRPSNYGGSQPGYSAPQPPPPTYQAVPVTGQSSSSGGGGSFLKGAAQTAAGVAAGALAFEGIRSLFSGGEHLGGGGFFGGGGVGGYGAPEETVVNNYYDSPRGDDRETNDDRDQSDNDSQDDSSDYQDSSSDDSGDYSDDDGSGGDFLA